MPHRGKAQVIGFTAYARTPMVSGQRSARGAARPYLRYILLIINQKSVSFRCGTRIASAILLPPLHSSHSVTLLAEQASCHRYIASLWHAACIRKRPWHADCIRNHRSTHAIPPLLNVAVLDLHSQIRTSTHYTHCSRVVRVPYVFSSSSISS